MRPKRVDVWNDGETKCKEGTRAWKKEDAKAKGALREVVPSSIYMEISEFRHFHEMWAARDTRRAYHPPPEVERQRTFSHMYCDEKGNVPTYL
jgi:hypothetical protein